MWIEGGLRAELGVRWPLTDVRGSVAVGVGAGEGVWGVES